MSPAHVLAFDYGASGGRAIAGSYDGRRIVLEELHRFSNDPVTLNGTIYWDVLRLFHEMKQGLAAARSREVSCIGIDTWGVDFALLDAGGGLLGNPVHYRDGRTVGMVDAALARMDAAQLYRHTGTQIMEMNTAFQLLSLRLNQPDVLARAGGLLMMPDFFRYCLTGARTTERSIASTTQLMDIHTGTWSRQVLDALELPPKLLPPVETPGRIAGLLSDGLCRELGLPQVPVAAVPGHDTQCAQAAVPAAEPEFLFM
ncbi:MAG: rhamnulokinase, partial [Clostridiales bacterium]|nr:rhamnulokinase [Clostridiales bacterium]